MVTFDRLDLKCEGIEGNFANEVGQSFFFTLALYKPQSFQTLCAPETKRWDKINNYERKTLS